MKKLSIAFLLLPTLLFADVCTVRVYIDESALNSYKEHVELEITSLKCKTNDVLRLEAGDARNAPNITKMLIFDSMAKYCDMTKSVNYDLTHFNYDLVCSFKRN